MSIITLETRSLTSEQRERLYELYHNTYSKIGGELLSKAEFIKKLTTHCELAVVCIDNDTIRNCILIRNTNYGKRIALVFGSNQLAKERIAMVKQALNNDCYVQANGRV